MKQRVVRRQRLVCDACYAAEEIDGLRYDMIGKRCPHCDTVMLTAEDYRIYYRLEWRFKLREWFWRIKAALGFKVEHGLISRSVIAEGELVFEARRKGLL
jgi:hypothetical protein